jgi:hypothetical protein
VAAGGNEFVQRSAATSFGPQTWWDSVHGPLQSTAPLAEHPLVAAATKQSAITTRSTYP